MTTDRRSREFVRCEFPGCPQAGPWRWPFCPSHYGQAAKMLRFEVDAELRRRLDAEPAEKPPPADLFEDLRPVPRREAR